MFSNSFNNPIFTHQRRGFNQIIPALIGAIGSVAAGALAAHSQKKQNQQNVQTAKDLADYQWQNFSSPSAQLAAYHSAGINPFASGQLGQAPQMQIPDQQSPGVVFGDALQTMVGNLSQLLQVEATIKNLNQQTDKAAAETQGQELLNSGIILDNRLKEFDLGQIKPATLKQIEAQIANTEAGSDLTRKQIKLAAEQILKTQYEAQGVDLKNRFQQMENEWKRIQGERGMPQNLAEWQEMQNQRLRQQINIDIPEEEYAKFRKQAFKNMETFFEEMNKPGTFDHFMGFNLGEGGKAMLRAVISMMLFKIMREF